MKLPKIEDEAIYQVIMGYSAEVTRAAGYQCRGSDPELKRRPALYLKIPFTEQERLDALRERFPDIDAANKLFR